MKFQLILDIEAEQGSHPSVKVTAPPDFNKHAVMQWCLFTAMSLNTLIEQETKSDGKIIIPQIQPVRKCF